MVVVDMRGRIGRLLERQCDIEQKIDVSKIERFSAERERRTSEIGELIMNRLRNIDKVAYVRFASVYLDFKDVHEFLAELQDLLQTKEVKALREPPKMATPVKGKPH